MSLSLNPHNFAVANKNKGLLDAGWKKAKKSECRRWLEVQSDLSSRRIRNASGELVEVICFHVKTTVPGQGATVIGPFETDKKRPEAAIAAAALLADLGLPLEMLVFHVDKFEFGTQHSPCKQSGSLIPSMGEVMA